MWILNLVVEQWTSSLPLYGYWRGHGVLPIQSTRVLWTWRRLTMVSPGKSCGGTLWECPFITTVREGVRVLGRPRFSARKR